MAPLARSASTWGSRAGDLDLVALVVAGGGDTDTRWKSCPIDGERVRRMPELADKPAVRGVVRGELMAKGPPLEGEGEPGEEGGEEAWPGWLAANELEGEVELEAGCGS